jgi:hypothetical protein
MPLVVVDEARLARLEAQLARVLVLLERRAEEERWVSRATAARVLNRSVDSIDRDIRSGLLQSRRVGRAIRILLASPPTETEVDQAAVRAVSR